MIALRGKERAFDLPALDKGSNGAFIKGEKEKMVRILGIGDAKMDKNITDMVAYPGGQALNIAVNAKLQGAQAGFIGCIGDDALGRHLAKTLDELGVDRSRSHIVHAQNAATKYQVIGGERVWGGTQPRPISPLQMAIRFMLPYYGLSGEDMAYIKTFDAVHLCNTAHMDEFLPRLKEAGVVLSYDYSNDHLQPGFMERVAPYLDVSLFSGSRMTETQMMEGLVKAHTLGTRIAIATNGDEGAVLYDGDRFYTQKPDPCDALDTMGAGDAFISAFLVDFVGSGGLSVRTGAQREEKIRHGLAYAASWAAKACMTPGAFGHGCKIDKEDEPFQQPARCLADR